MSEFHKNTNTPADAKNGDLRMNYSTSKLEVKTEEGWVSMKGYNNKKTLVLPTEYNLNKITGCLYSQQIYDYDVHCIASHIVECLNVGPNNALSAREDILDRYVQTLPIQQDAFTRIVSIMLEVVHEIEIMIWATNIPIGPRTNFSLKQLLGKDIVVEVGEQ